MKHSLPSLDSLKAFESAARHLSFSLAAHELCITKGAVSYQIRKLEEELQCELFKRSIRQVYLTDAGQTLFNSTKKLFKEFENTFSHLKEVKQQTNVSIATTTYVAARWLSSRIGRFSKEYPSINIVFQHSVNNDEFTLDDADIAILWGPNNNHLDNTLFAHISMPMFPVISPRMLNTHNIGTSVSMDIKFIQEEPFCKIPLLCEDRQLDMWHEWYKTGKTDAMKPSLSNPRRVISDANVRVQAAIDGQGFILADDLMLNEINNGLLHAPFKEKLTGYGYGFYNSSSRKYVDNALILKDWLVKNT